MSRDRWVGRSKLPRTIGEVDAAYLSRLLGVNVKEVRPFDVTHGTTDRALLALHSDDERIPGSAFVKISPTKLVPCLFTSLTRLGFTECGFYRDVRPSVEIESPRALALDQDPRSPRFTVVIDDLAAKGARFTDVIRGVSLAEAYATLSALASLHGAFWGSLRLSDTSPGGLAWVFKNGEDPLLPIVHKAVIAAGRKLTKQGSPYMTERGLRILAEYPRIAREMDDGPQTLLHGDPHPGNLYFLGGDGHGELRGGLIDWQVLRRGNGLRDAAYFLILALTPDVRRQHGGTLLNSYRRELTEAGGPELGADEVFATVRKMAAYAYTSAVFTAAFGGLQAEAIATEGLARASDALDEYNTDRALETLR